MKMMIGKKKISSIMVMVALFIGLFANMQLAKAENITNAKYYQFGTIETGYISDSNYINNYSFTLYESGMISIDVTAYIYRTDYYIYNADGDEIWSATWQYWNSATEQMHLQKWIDLTAGLYYFSVKQNSGTGDYRFSIDFESANESIAESGYGINNSVQNASDISLDTTYIGQIAANDDKDIYKFVLQNSGKVALGLTAYIYRTDYHIYNIFGDEIWARTWQYWNDTTQQMRLDEDIYLTSGTYYLSIEKNSGTGNYIFSLDYTDSNESFAETDGGNNNDINSASVIQLGKIYIGQIAHNDYLDMYQFTLTDAVTIQLEVSAFIYRTDYEIYDEKGNSVWSKTWQYWNDTTGVMELSQKINLGSTGIYYFAVRHNNGFGNYNFQITKYKDISSININKQTVVLGMGKMVQLKASISPNNATDKNVNWYSNNSNVASVSSSGIVTAGSVGSAIVTVESQADKDIKATCLIVVKPGKAKISNLRSYDSYGNTKKKVYFDVTANGGGDGYQAVYSKSKSMSNTKKGNGSGMYLKKGTYYFKVRAYVVVNNKKYYGAWSKVKKFKVK